MPPGPSTSGPELQALTGFLDQQRETVRTAVELDPEQLRQRYRDARARSQEVVAGAGSLDQLSVGTARDGTRWDLRWVLLHMLDETSRPAGHGDLLREAIDGSVGE